MTSQRRDDTGVTELFEAMFSDPARAGREMMAQFLPALGEAVSSTGDPAGDAAHWAALNERLQRMWLDFQKEQADKAADTPMSHLVDPSTWLGVAESWLRQMPLADPDVQKRLVDDTVLMWEGVLAQFGLGPQDSGAEVRLPRKDRRFSDPRWREQPLFALLHQTYLLLAEQITAMAERMEGLDPAKKDQLRFTTRMMLDAFSPDHFPMTNPVVLQKIAETRGENLVQGLEHLISDLRRGQLTHTDGTVFKLGENIASTPGKVVHETPLYQLIQYTPTTDSVLEVPLVIFPPWINRFYILDLSPEKSFIRWAVEQGITVFVVSWKSADETMAEVLWDDYIRAQIDAIDTIRDRLGVKNVHAIGYCVAGTTLAATLAVLARRGQADKVKSATFFTAQVDFEKAGELRVFIDDAQLSLIEQLGSDKGYLDGRYMAATFNLLRGNDLIWSYVVKNYLLGEGYPAFDLLHWNGDTTNLPAKWHQNYLRDLYRDNKLVVPDALSADGTPIDLTRIETPAYIQAGREDHIAPLESVWRMTRHLRGPTTFVLAGSGHIAGVVNPPSSRKYQYWTNPEPCDSLESFVSGAVETPGSWWPHWRAWLQHQDGAMVPVKGRRIPGGKGDRVIEDAPGRYVKTP